MFLKECKNELLKLRSIKLVIMTVIFLLLSNLVVYKVDTLISYSGNWKEEVREEIKEAKANLDEITIKEYRDSELDNIKMLQYRLDHNLSPSATVLSYVIHAQSTRFILMMLCIYLVSRILCAEMIENTESVYRVRGISKRVLDASKLSVSLLVVLGVNLLNIILSLVIGFAFIPTKADTMNLLVSFNGKPYIESALVLLGEGILINLVISIFFIALMYGLSKLSHRYAVILAIPLIIFNTSGLIQELVIRLGANQTIVDIVGKIRDMLGANVSTLSSSVISGGYMLVATSVVIMFVTVLSRMLVFTYAGKWK